MLEVEAQRNPLRNLVRHTLVYGSGYVTIAVAGLLLVPLYTHRLSPSGYGLLGLMLVLYGLMKQVYDFGTTNSIARFFFDQSGRDAEQGLLDLRATALLFLLAYGAALTLALYVPADFWSRLLTQSSHHGDLVRIVAATLYAEALAIVPLTLIRMEERSRLFVTITVGRFLITIGATVLLVVGLGWGVRGALAANAASALGVLVLLLPELLRACRGRPSRQQLRELLAFGAPFFPVILSAWFIEASDRYLLGIYRSHAEVGYYVLGYKVAQIMQISIAAFTMGWAPLRYQILNREDAAEVYRRLTTLYAVAAAILTVGVSLFAREIVAAIAPREYAPAARIVPLIALSYSLNGLYILVLTGMGVAKRTMPLAFVVGAAAVANIALNVVLIPPWGMEAAAVTTVLANVIMVAGSWYFSQRVYPIPYDWRRILATVGLGTAVVSVVVIATPGHGVASIAAGVVGWAGFVALLLATKTISPADASTVRDRLRNLAGRAPRGPERHAVRRFTRGRFGR